MAKKKVVKKVTKPKPKPKPKSAPKPKPKKPEKKLKEPHDIDKNTLWLYNIIKDHDEKKDYHTRQGVLSPARTKLLDDIQAQIEERYFGTV